MSEASTGAEPLSFALTCNGEDAGRFPSMDAAEEEAEQLARMHGWPIEMWESYTYGSVGRTGGYPPVVYQVSRVEA